MPRTFQRRGSCSKSLTGLKPTIKTPCLLKSGHLSGVLHSATQAELFGGWGFGGWDSLGGGGGGSGGVDLYHTLIQIEDLGKASLYICYPQPSTSQIIPPMLCYRTMQYISLHNAKPTSLPHTVAWIIQSLVSLGS